MSDASDPTESTDDDGLSIDELPQPEFEGTVPVDELEVDGENPNTMEDSLFSLLCERMRERGWTGGPVLADTDNVIADGQHRWMAAKEIGLEEVPVKKYDLTDEERRLWRQEMNKIEGEHDEKRDALEFDRLAQSEVKDDMMDLLDARDESIDEYLDLIRMGPPEQQKHDVYTVDHNVYYEDCVEGMRKRLDDNSVDVVFTSPPYNVDLKENFQINESDHDKITYSDDRDWEEFTSFLREVFAEVARVVKPSGHVFINFQNDIREGTVKPPTDWLPELVPLPWRSFVVWDKGSSATINGKLGEYGDGVYAANWEPIFHFTENPRPLNGTGGEQLGVWNIPAANREFEHDSGDHPAPFPVALVDKALRTASNEGDTVLDPFMGSGTTAVAAIESNRDYIGFELDEDGAYKPIIERRIDEAVRQRNSPTNKELREKQRERERENENEDDEAEESAVDGEADASEESDLVESDD